MKKVELIDANEYFVESRKVLQIVTERENVMKKKMKTADKLDLVRKHKTKATSLEEFETLESLEKELDRKLRFNQLKEPAVPEEHKEKIKRNVAVELKEVNELLNKTVDQLKSSYKYLEDEVIPLITNIEKLGRLKTIPAQIETVIDGEIGEHSFLPLGYLTQIHSRSEYAEIAKNINVNLDKAIQGMKKIELATKRGGK